MFRAGDVQDLVFLRGLRYFGFRVQGLHIRCRACEVGVLGPGFYINVSCYRV